MSSRSSISMPAGSAPTIAGFKWSERFNCYQTRIGAFTVGFSWSMTSDVRGFVPSINGVRVDHPELRDKDEAARFVLGSLRGRLESAIRILDAAKESE